MSTKVRNYSHSLKDNQPRMRFMNFQPIMSFRQKLYPTSGIMLTLVKAAYNETTFMTRCDKKTRPRKNSACPFNGPRHFDLASDRVTDRRKGRGVLLARFHHRLASLKRRCNLEMDPPSARILITNMKGLTTSSRHFLYRRQGI